MLSSKNTEPTDLINCGLGGSSLSRFMFGRFLDVCKANNNEKTCNDFAASILKNTKVARCLCDTSFGLGDNVTTVKTYSDVVYPKKSTSE